MDRAGLATIASEFIEGHGDNFISERIAISKDVIGTKIFESPAFAFGDPDDALFALLKDGTVVGPHFMAPREWLPGARTVISFFLPFSRAVKEGNSRDMSYPSAEWLHARIEGQELINKLCRHLQSKLAAEGFEAVVPSLDGRFWSRTERKGEEQWEGPGFTSNWSERHVAYVCGLGTFGLSKGLITPKGMAGRFGSLVSSIALPFDARDYSSPYARCIMCGACADNCPAHAITLSGGKDHLKCHRFVQQVLAKSSPRYGCGKCQVAVPCESCIPERKHPSEG